MFYRISEYCNLGCYSFKQHVCSACTLYLKPRGRFPEACSPPGKVRPIWPFISARVTLKSKRSAASGGARVRRGGLVNLPVSSLAAAKHRVRGYNTRDSSPRKRWTHIGCGERA